MRKVKDGKKPHPLLGKEIIYKRGGKDIPAFVAGIDSKKGLTIVAVEPKKAWWFTNKDGELHCMDLSYVSSFYEMPEKDRFRVAIRMIKKGVFDCDEYDKKTKLNRWGDPNMIPCVFK